jgi:photosystem II stability/assembly factor-like uncharacterized protein
LLADFSTRLLANALRRAIRIVTFSLLVSFPAIGQWVELNPLLPRVKYYGIDFVGPDTGWAVGESGAIIRTTNGGAKWQQVPTGIQTRQLAVDSYDGQTVISIGDTGRILRSSNAGITWGQVSSGRTTNLWNIQFVNSDLGWIVGSQATALKTTDGGQSWITQSTGISGITFWSVHFTNERIGYIACSGGIILKTTNGGNNWQTQPAGDGSSLYSIVAIDSLVVVAAGFAGELVRTTNGGATWIELPRLGSTINDIAFADSTRGFATGEGGYFVTTDAGATWEEQLEGPFGFALSCPTKTIVYGTGERKLSILKSTNGGLNFAKTILNDDFDNASFATINTGNILAGLGGVRGDSLLRTTNGGLNWKAQGDFSQLKPFTVYFVDSLLGFVATEYVRLFMTADGGKTWTSKQVIGLVDTIGWFKDFFFVNRQIGWLVGGLHGTIAKTTDGGSVWFVQRSTRRTLTNIHFSDSLYGWVVGNQLTMYRTTNGGATWLDVVPPMNVLTQDVYFQNRNEGWLLSANTLFKTTDSGTTWLPVFTHSSGLLREMQWASTLHGFLVGIGDQVLETTDGGKTWLQAREVGAMSIRTMSFPKSNSGYGVGGGGIIMKYLDTTTTGFRNTEPGNSWDFRLNQNYPNPFNPETKIVFQISEDHSFVSLKLFDVVGREIETLFSGSVDSGRYEVTVERAKLSRPNMASGVYFYRLITKSKKGFWSETKRMILLR